MTVEIYLDLDLVTTRVYQPGNVTSAITCGTIIKNKIPHPACLSGNSDQSISHSWSVIFR